jgi:hypothetical protein
MFRCGKGRGNLLQFSRDEGRLIFWPSAVTGNAIPLAEIMFQAGINGSCK